jgi:transcriptional regulator with XRE-family HTH domain
MSEMDEIIRTLKKRRTLLRITQEDLAQISGTSLRTLKAIESGKGNPTFATLLKILNAIGMTLKAVIK